MKAAVDLAGLVSALAGSLHAIDRQIGDAREGLPYGRDREDLTTARALVREAGVLLDRVDVSLRGGQAVEAAPFYGVTCSVAADHRGWFIHQGTGAAACRECGGVVFARLNPEGGRA